MVQELGKKILSSELGVATVVSLLTILTGTILLALNFNFFWLAYPIGFGGILPFAIMVSKNYDTQVRENKSETSEEETALEELKKKFVNDEISEEEFENRVENLVQTQDVQTSKEYIERTQNSDNSREKDKEVEKQ